MRNTWFGRKEHYQFLLNYSQMSNVELDDMMTLRHHAGMKVAWQTLDREVYFRFKRETRVCISHRYYIVQIKLND